MTTYRRRPSPETLARIRALSERRLSAEEVEASLRVPIGDEEREEILRLVSWFRRRYPTPADRLAYVRRAYRRWQAALGPHPCREPRNPDPEETAGLPQRPGTGRPSISTPLGSKGRDLRIIAPPY